MCATSIGSTFSHSPVPGVRKSGIPEGTEIPAPVSATTEPAPRTSSASRATPAEPPAPLTSGPAPLRLALLDEGGDALAPVLGGQRGDELLALELDARVELGVGAQPL